MKLLALIFFFFSHALAFEPQPPSSPETTQAFQADNLPYFTPATLFKNGFIADSNISMVLDSSQADFASISNSNICKILPSDRFATTIYNIDLKAGIVTCMFGEKSGVQLPSNLYHPMGLFDIQVPKIKEFYAYDATATAPLQSELQRADALFATLKTKKQAASNALNQTSSTFLNVPQMLLAALLQDPQIIDVQASAATGKLQLTQGYTSKFTEGGVTNTNENLLLVDGNTMFVVYAKLGELSLWYMLILLTVFGGAALAKYGIDFLGHKLEKKEQPHVSTPFIVGIVFSVLFFFPSQTPIENADENFKLLKTNFQAIEKAGYYTFNDWANEAARVMIDAEVDALIFKSGIGTKEQIINAYAGQIQHQKSKDFFEANLNTCKQIYNYDALKSQITYESSGHNLNYGLNNENLFPPSEVSAVGKFELSPINNLAYYHLESTTSFRGLIREGYAAQNDYPSVSFSQCSRAYDNFKFHSDMHKAHNDQLRGLLTFDRNEAGKIAILEKIVDFQYKLFRDWGYLAILGLPATKMQTEYIGGLYNDPTSETVKALQKKLGEGSGYDYSIMSSLPYLFVPGAGAVFDIVKENITAFGTAAGGATSSIFGAFLGGMLGKLAGGTIALPIAYQAAKTFLEILPIVAIVAIGTLRFVIIFIKIFAIHFSSLFILPLMFASRNLEAISKFAMKIITTMLELPLFALSVWLAITTYGLIKSVGLVFGKKIMIGMLENSDVQYANTSNFAGVPGYLNQLKIYFFDGIIEVSISLISVVIVYKMITSLHTYVFEMIELAAPKTLDNAIEAIRKESDFEKRI